MTDDNILGGDAGLVDSNPKRGRGVYAKNPASVPRFHAGNDEESVKAQARMVVDFPDRQTFMEYLEQLPSHARRLAEVISSESNVNSIGFYDFILEQFQESYQEKFQVAEVLSDNHVSYFFGQQAPQFGLSGTLLNTEQDPWYDAFYVLYQEVIRGSKLARKRIPLKLYIDNKEITGSLINLSLSLNAKNETAVPFQFSILVSKVRLLNKTNLTPTNLGSFSGSVEDAFSQAEQSYAQTFASIQQARRVRAMDSYAYHRSNNPESSLNDMDPELANALGYIDDNGVITATGRVFVEGERLEQQRQEFEPYVTYGVEDLTGTGNLNINEEMENHGIATEFRVAYDASIRESVQELNRRQFEQENHNYQTPEDGYLAVGRNPNQTTPLEETESNYQANSVGSRAIGVSDELSYNPYTSSVDPEDQDIISYE